MSFRKFKLERYFSLHEFHTKYIACASDAESFSLTDVLKLSNPESVEKYWNKMTFAYTDSQGHPLLRENICKMYANYYRSHEKKCYNFNTDEVLIAAPEECILIAMKAILSSDFDSHMIVISPAYQSLYENAMVLKNVSISKWKIQLNKNTNNWFLDMNELKNLLQANTKLLVINFPHNPTGFTPVLSQYLQIIEFCKENDLYLFSDEMYWFLWSPLINSQQSLVPACMLYEKAISLSGMSKTFAMPGLRIGWLVCRDASLMNKFLLLKDYTTICNSAPSEILSLLALEDNRYLQIIHRTHDILNENRALLMKFIIKNNDIFYWTQFNDEYGGCTKFIGLKLKELNRLMFKTNGTKTAIDICNLLINQCGVMLLPGSMFEYDDRFVRFGLGRKNLKPALQILDDFFQQLRSKKNHLHSKL